ncbi:MAG: aspartate kinase [Gammaproteobacteria bacterium RIFCSPHIGHO2_12_FULL_41_15]|nr:MAG: aspartate kinase [Gammaproteobacteria bacterium RIFCSPHIGHO2_12_FULL_41_15]
MALLIQKFGGSSVANLERLQAVARIIINTKEQGHQVVIVVSAMYGETDQLLQLSQRLNPKASKRDYDVLLASGEQKSSALLAMALQGMGHDAVSLLGWQLKVLTNDSHSKARIQQIDCDLLNQYLLAGTIPIVAGFQGVSNRGEITTLGRGGSDTSAVAIAAAMRADECLIYTDVDGVYTSDPRVVPKARRISQLTYEAMLEMASLGAKVLQIRAVEFASKYAVPIRVLSSYSKGEGTLITEEQSVEQPLVSGVAFDRHQARITITGIPVRYLSVSTILQALSDANIHVDMIIQNASQVDTVIDFSFTVQSDDYLEAKAIANHLQQKLSASAVIASDKVAKLSLIGVGLRNHANVGAMMFSALESENIPVFMISTSEIKISALIDEACLEQGARVLHSKFGLDLEPNQAINII